MCWSIIYHENKIALDNADMDYSIYKKANVLENNGYSFQINKINIQNKIFYNITHNQCACDFFNSKKYKKLQEEFINFILKRMEIICIEPCILVKWIKDINCIDNVPNKIINISKSNIKNIFSKGSENGEVYYCIKRE